MALTRVRLSAQEKLNLISNISTMLTAGIPLTGTIDTLLEEAKGGQRQMLEAILADLSAGKSLSQAFSAFPLVFDAVTVNLLRAAEEAGTLEQTLKDLEHTQRKDIEFVDKVKSAMFYPMMVVVVFVIVLTVILVVVMPKISQVFSRMNMPLPLPTRIMIASSNFLVAYWPFVLAALFVLGAVLFVLYREQQQRFKRVLLAVPGISTLSKQIDVTRFTRVLHLLLGSGIPITAALELAQAVASNHTVYQRIQTARDQASAGMPFSSGLKGKGSPFPSMMVKLMEVGEKTGTLEKAMLDVSNFMDDQVSKTLAKLTMMLEPIMLVLVGLAVAMMMMSIIGPIYGMIGQVANR
jgi:type II secretory pathway component PulF